ARDLGDALLHLAGEAALGRPRGARWQGRAAGRAGAAPQGRRAGAGARAKDVRAGDRGKTLAGVGMRQRVGRSRELVAEGHSPSVVARVARVSRQALYRVSRPRRTSQPRPPADPVEAAIVEEALANQTDGYRMVTAFVRRKLGIAVNRKRVLRVMRERKLIQRRRPLERRKRPGFFRVERPRQLWQLDLTSVWVAEHGWTYLM